MTALAQALADVQTAVAAVQAAAAARPKNQVLALVNGSKTFLVAPGLIQALQVQVDRDLFPAWNIRCEIVLAPGPSPTTVPNADWYLLITDQPDQAGALGWHDETNGRPYGEVFVAPSVQGGVSVSSVLSHELCELLADPQVDSLVMNQQGNTLYPLEVCDPVQNDSYMIGSVEVSNFVLPAYFNGGPKPWDHLGKLNGPLPGMTTGGYLSYLNITPAQAGWQQIGARRPGTS